MKPLRINKPYTSDTRESEVSAGWHPEEINQLCTSDTRESELTAQCIADGINQVCTSDAGEGELTPEWNREETINCTPLTLGIVNSLLNETLNEINKLQRWHLGKWTHCWMKPWWNQHTVHLAKSGKWTHRKKKPGWNNKLCTSDSPESELAGEWNSDETMNCAPLTLGKVNSQLNQTVMKK